jgi:selenocysteine-specific elongation factor
MVRRPKTRQDGKTDERPDSVFPGDEEVLIGLARNKGLKGVREGEAELTLPLGRTGLQQLAQKLEEAGSIRILSFSPLFFVSQGSLDFLSDRLMASIAKFHAQHPDLRGVSTESLQKKFNVPREILRLALKSLVHEGRLKEDAGRWAEAAFRRRLPSREEHILSKLEALSFQGGFSGAALKDIQAQFRVSPGKLEEMMSVLVERKKIVPGKEGFYLHSQWLDEVIEKVRSLGKSELTVGEFKTMTGLSRKYAIPLLELLDELGVTRRKGAVREIL